MFTDLNDAPEALPSELVSMQFPKTMLFLIKGFAKREGIEYQELIKKWLDEKIMENSKVIK